MDKKELYYIIMQGTNSRWRNENEEVVMFLPNHVDRFLELVENAHSHSADYIKITVEEYERTFGVSN